jgi:dienelactone hydrolase
MKSLYTAIVLLIAFFAFINTKSFAQANKSNIIGTEVTYQCNGVQMKSYVAYDAAIKGKRPAIVVVPEWWGNNEYAKKRARMLAELGYIAIAADIYGEGKQTADPQTAQSYATPFYKNPNLAQACIESAINQLKTYPQTDAQKIAAIGYCFGGSMVLNAIKLGTDLKGVVSFHGGLATVPTQRGVVKGRILVCHGAEDKFISVTDLEQFRLNLDTTGVAYQFITYPNAVHAFTNPASTENGKRFQLPIAYNEAADKRSWEDMKAFFILIFN